MNKLLISICIIAVLVGISEVWLEPEEEKPLICDEYAYQCYCADNEEPYRADELYCNDVLGYFEDKNCFWKELCIINKKVMLESMH